MDRLTITDGSTEIVRGALAAGVEFYAGYPITPASRIYEQMIGAGVGMGCPDEITVLQTVMGASLAGRKVMTATSGPGFALMVESLGAAQQMEVPLTVVLVQRLGPSSGAATASAQGDLGSPLSLSGGTPLPTLCPARVEDCARLAAQAVNIAEALRTPVVLLTERDMVSAVRTLEQDEAGEEALSVPEPAERPAHSGGAEGYTPYGELDERQVPRFLPVGSDVAQTRFTASTHGGSGAILKTQPEALANTTRLYDKLLAGMDLFPRPRLDLQPGAETLVVSFGITDYAAREAVEALRAEGRKVSHATLLTLYPLFPAMLEPALAGVRKVVVPEENLHGLFRTQLLGTGLLDGMRVAGVNQIGRVVSPEQIVAEVKA